MRIGVQVVKTVFLTRMVTRSIKTGKHCGI